MMGKTSDLPQVRVSTQEAGMNALRRTGQIAAAMGVVFGLTLGTSGAAHGATVSGGSVVLEHAIQAEPGCTLTHDAHPYSDNDGGGWQLELDARCTENSGAKIIRWTFSFWAETHDGGRVIQYFNGSHTGGEARVHPAPRHYLAAGAPSGHPRYCYRATAVFHGVPSSPYSGVPERILGTHCKNS